MAVLTTIRVFHSPAEALIARSVLEAYGVAAFLQDWNFGSNAWHKMQAIQGIRLDVLDRDVRLAAELLNTKAPSDAAHRPLHVGSLAFGIFALLFCFVPHPVRRKSVVNPANG